MQQASAHPPLTATLDPKGDRMRLAGDLDINTLVRAEASLHDWMSTRKSRVIDLSELKHLDTPGALFLSVLRGKGVELTGIGREHKALLDFIGGLDFKPLPPSETPPKWRQLLIRVGKASENAWHEARDVISFLGRSCNVLVAALIHPSTLRLPAIARHVSETGIHALPIVGLMAVMISIVVGYQSVAQLRPLGGEEFTVNLVAVSVLREMGVLITAIMVAGRSGAAFTAEIGVMKMREEVDALSVMGVDPMQVLVVPRLMGLIIALPLLAFFSDMMGLVGGALISLTLLDISPLQYLLRVRTAVDGWDLFVGLFKAPIFALVIGVVGCMHGLRVTGSAESVGTETTRAVVKAIFLVIVLDALFSILFEQLGI
jgi:phospholipid/cholesterol/gamma-HCH transport system permease protein